jgi:hypothetical protein
MLLHAALLYDYQGQQSGSSTTAIAKHCCAYAPGAPTLLQHHRTCQRNHAMFRSLPTKFCVAKKCLHGSSSSSSSSSCWCQGSSDQHEHTAVVKHSILLKIINMSLLLLLGFAVLFLLVVS